MSYANVYALQNDADFVGRINACATEQAMVFKDDGRAAIAAYAETIIPTGQAPALVPAVSTAPGFGDVTDQSEIDDGQILSAVQAAWPTVAELIFPGLAA